MNEITAGELRTSPRGVILAVLERTQGESYKLMRRSRTGGHLLRTGAVGTSTGTSAGSIRRAGISRRGANGTAERRKRNELL